MYSGDDFGLHQSEAKLSGAGTIRRLGKRSIPIDQSGIANAFAQFVQT
jgi:hypothetical protein